MTDEHIIAYLLKELPEADLERFEEQCFAQEEWPAQINLVEEDLIEAYLLDELTPERRQRFEQNYLNTVAGKRRVLVAAALLRCAEEHHTALNQAGVVPPQKSTWVERFRAFWSSQSWALRAAAAVAALVLIGGALWFFRPPPSPRTFATLTLTISRGNRAEGVQPNPVKLTRDIDALKISLVLPQQSPPAADYRVELDELEKNTGETRPAKVTGRDAQSVLVEVPAAQLARGRYALKLFAVQADGTVQRINGSYYFIVE